MSYGVLVVEDEQTLAKNVGAYLQRYGYEVRIATDGETALAELESYRPEAVVLDFNLPGMTGLELLTRVRSFDPQICVIMVTGHGSEQVAVDAMKAGAYDYLSKPVVLSKLKLVLDKALGEERREQELSYYRRKDASDGGLSRLIGESPPMQELRATISRIVEAESQLTDAQPPAVLITGDTGTGKELIARALHFEGPRKRRPFVEVNCSSIPANLLEAELFGYERGAFTDAKERKIGLIEAASGGTLFLDEIGEIDLSLQVKLLKLLEDKMVRRLGSVRENHADVRIIAATNRDLERLVQEGRFRSDLFFRLRIVHIETPPLRARDDDVIKLAEAFLEIQRTRYGKPKLRLSAEAIAALRAHHWPGNVRELKNVMEQSVVMARGDSITHQELALSGARYPAAALDDDGTPDQLAMSIPRNGFKLSDIERDLLRQALEQSGWNISKAARLLGLSRDTLRYRIEKFDLKLPC
jgi:two-component system, NtrC family, response regulator AtoC